ncbi:MULTISPECIES: hypothetical protein [Sphingobium]|jgi:hypothetical protein|uniref:hypothetical protein n=1 Tax=Sphingobium TaxID=165695 RepID=UPI000C692017|nr:MULTISPECIES: hypothetical protein [Sphingobium]MAP44335.1 hypothetical protein [Sphingobium sp.]MAX14137.1 hypothetical protein [Sphingobium sp.]MBS48482.1 hypothetical protein [Sphingobium sp.]MCC4256720.1 hypothetical protein [Sphingobium lactosutens]HCW60106.1 hypothetical protein [Sphingobium sp.]|tara:strand:+ start:6680 stop:7114 length:435 start_codon:yes stop_codon:yes gene_type:complete
MADYMVTGLVKRRAALAGDMKRAQEALSQMARDLETLDAAIKLVAPDMEIEAIAPKFVKPPEDWSRRGEMSRQVLSILRTSPKPLTAREIASRMIVDRGLAATPKLLNLMTRRVSTCLRDRREQGLVRNPDTRVGLWMEWEVVR